jgi:hypothetical protein
MIAFQMQQETTPLYLASDVGRHVSPDWADLSGLNSVYNTALEALLRPSCRGLFSGADPSAVLKGIYDGSANGSSIHWANSGPPSNGSVIAATTTGILGRNENGQSIFTGVIINFNSNLSAPWFSGYPDLFDIEQQDSVATQNIYRAVTLLHELGHAFNIITGLGSSQIVADGKDADPTGAFSAVNTATVYKNCFE